MSFKRFFVEARKTKDIEKPHLDPKEIGSTPKEITAISGMLDSIPYTAVDGDYKAIQNLRDKAMGVRQTLMHLFDKFYGPRPDDDSWWSDRTMESVIQNIRQTDVVSIYLQAAKAIKEGGQKKFSAPHGTNVPSDVAKKFISGGYKSLFQKFEKIVVNLHKDKKSQEDISALLKQKIKLPAGFSFKDEVETWGQSDKFLKLNLVSPDIKIVFKLSPDTNQIGGDTLFKDGSGGWRTFSRRGVDDSFYMRINDDPNPIIDAQIKRAQEAIGRWKTVVQVPGLPFSITPDRVEDLKKQLKTTGTATLTPSGFGTGYQFTKKKLYSYSRPASKELVDFFGQGPLYMSTMDCD